MTSLEIVSIASFFESLSRCWQLFLFFKKRKSCGTRKNISSPLSEPRLVVAGLSVYCGLGQISETHNYTIPLSSCRNLETFLGWSLCLARDLVFIFESSWMCIVNPYQVTIIFKEHFTAFHSLPLLNSLNAHTGCENVKAPSMQHKYT